MYHCWLVSDTYAHFEWYSCNNSKSSAYGLLWPSCLNHNTDDELQPPSRANHFSNEDVCCKFVHFITMAIMDYVTNVTVSAVLGTCDSCSLLIWKGVCTHLWQIEVTCKHKCKPLKQNEQNWATSCNVSIAYFWLNYTILLCLKMFCSRTVSYFHRFPFLSPICHIHRCIRLSSVHNMHTGEKKSLSNTFSCKSGIEV